MNAERLPKLSSLDLAGKRVMIRVDFNVPLENGVVGDLERIDVAIPTIKYVMEQGGVPILVSHLGRPEGKRDPQFSLAPLVPILEEKLGTEIFFVEHAPREDVLAIAGKTARQDGGVVLLENIRFQPEEEAGDEEFAKLLAGACDVYVNEAFSASHRGHASITGVAKFAKEKAAGLYFTSEVAAMERVLAAKEHPIVLVLGGAKIDTKIGVVERLVIPCDRFLIGGALANTFLAAKGHNMCDSLVQQDKLDVAQKIMLDIQKDHDLLVLPTDVVVGYKGDLPPKEVLIDTLCEGWAAYDIGTQTMEAFERALRNARTIIWNGPLGLCKDGKFMEGTRFVAEAIANSEKAFSLVGGGDTLDALQQMGMDRSRFGHVSTAGGAMLEFLEQGSLPGVDALL